ncbi:hypothetical protein AC482_00005 [miscellaneous Crenarchaeota group-15 archaeon DG-45]|uniref:DUF1616 domain-containing protein n=1 Tax=miscellaneous Crenarchaeota group-15 archaeon DG-45 TaxID=1685127 RepID=A0A0M0BT15_9ARCH|nr:MAG: hypothetical protein AC482_00005 [miscellaneous Crenarchaeota group-15 archaeon DG-45]
MSSKDKEIIITIDARRLIALCAIAIICIATLYSYIGALFAFIAPSEDFPFDVGVATFDTGDVSKTSFARGDTVRVKATVEKGTGYYYNSYIYYFPYTYYATTYKVIIAITDADGKAAYFSYESETIGYPGQSLATTFNVPISSEASKGTYTIKIMAWTDWLPSGVAMSPTAGEAMFTVS